MREKLPADFPSWEVADAAFELFFAELDLRRVQLRERLAATGGPELDGSLESMTPLARWYFDVAMGDEDDGMQWWPRWLPPTDPAWRPQEGHGPQRDLSPQFVRLWELVAVYIADVVLPWVPHARWVCWRGKAASDITNGGFVLDFGDPIFPFGPLWAANPGLSDKYMEPDSESFHIKRLSPDNMEPEIRRSIVERDTLRKGKPLKWQLAPTGPDAHRRTTKPTW